MVIDSLTESIKTVSIDYGSKKVQEVHARASARVHTDNARRRYLKGQYVVTFVDKVLTGCSKNSTIATVVYCLALLRKPRTEVQNKNLFGQHTLFLIHCLDNHKSTTLGLAKEALLKQFPDLEDIYIPSPWKHVTVDCTFSLKRASLYNEERDAERTLRLRYEVVSKCKEIGVDFKKNCVFVDEAGFNTHMIRVQAWSKVGDPANVTVHKQRGANISIVGCIAYSGTVNFSKVEPLTKAAAEKLMSYLLP